VMALLKQSTVYVRTFFMVQSADHITAITGAAPSITLSKNGGAFGAAGGSVAEISGGWYKVSLTTTDTNTLGDLSYVISGTAADPVAFCDQVIAIDLATTPGTAGGLFIAGTNAPVTITGSGNALTLSSTGANGNGISTTGNGTGCGINASGASGLRATGSGASNYGIEAIGSGATDSGGIKATATTSGEGFEGIAAGNGHGLYIVGAGTGEGLHATAGAGANAHGCHFEGVGANSSGLMCQRGGSGGDDINLFANDFTIPTVTSVTNDVGITQAGADKVWSSATRSLSTFGTLVSDIAYTIFTADLTLIVGEASRSLLNAIRFLRNRWRINSGVLTVYKEDDTTSAWTAPVTTTAGANPITEIDPT